MTNILFLIGTYPNYGGTEKVTTFLANQFIEDGHKVFIASFEQPEPSLSAELKKSIELISLEYPVLKKENRKILREEIRNKNIDIIINQWALPFQTNILCKTAIGKNSSCKLISVFHNAPNKNARVTKYDIILSQQNINYLKEIILKSKRFFIRSLIRISMHYVYKNSDQYVILSDSFKKIFSEYAMIKDLSKLSVVTNPLTIDEVDWKRSDKEKLLIYVGRIDYNQKRVERIISLWENVSKNLEDWSLEIVGDGPERKKLEEIVEEKNIKRVKFEGFQNPLNYYKRASLLLLTSEYEGFGLVLVEGMRYGVVPLVYGSYESVYDILEDQKTGFITKKPYSQLDFENIINNITKNKERLNILSENCVIESEKFTIREISNSWYKLFNEIKNKK